MADPRPTSPQFRRDLSKVLTIALFFAVINEAFAYLNWALLYSSFCLEPNPAYEFWPFLALQLTMGFILGVVGGACLVVINSRVFRKRSFSFALIATGIMYVTLFTIANATFAMMEVSALVDMGQTQLSWGEEVVKRMFQPLAWVFFCIWGFITLLTLFLLQVNDKFGPGIMRKFILGQYYQPREEQRVFMFLDMVGSTTIAEEVGHSAYFNLLRDAFSDITSPILACQGEIYQYVGDEIVVSWSLEKGFRDANCLRCFNEIKKKLEKLAPRYREKYGVVPHFRAGLHYGTVMAGEIGDIKKDIVYTGDVLNTASRIQGLCKTYDSDIMVSRATLEHVKGKHQMTFEPVGEIQLRGRNDKVYLHALVNGS